jgi:phage gp46-like protein
LDFAEADAKEAAYAPVEQSGTARSVECDAEAQQVEVLRGFIVVARARLTRSSAGAPDEARGGGLLCKCRAVLPPSRCCGLAGDG